MGVVTWSGDAVTTSDSVEVPRPISGAQLRDAYIDSVQELMLGLVRFRDNAWRIGRVDLLRFGDERVGRDFVEWHILGGVLARPGGVWRIESKNGEVTASTTGHRPAIPRPLYDISHLQVHQLVTHLYLQGLRENDPPPGIEAPREDRLRAAAVDVAFCLTLARLTGRRRLTRTLVITAAYHVACWSLLGRTLGGVVLRERVTSLDGSRPTATQSVLRFALMPLSWISRRPLHDEVARTTVIRD
ncbi:MAG TPA: RDD family protein [Candidatus Dormibacteraeota bacterium]|nr:RDD family protein [Candidatus Dormibacteraeota bacterium]